MSPDTRLARFDERLEPQRFSIGIVGCAVLPCGELPHGKSKEIKPHPTFIGMKGMGDAGFVGVEL
jgi:hypothetical protein